MQRSLMRLAGIATLAVLALALTAGSYAEQSGNLLINPGFEGFYVKQCCENTTQFQANTPIEQVQVAYGWTAWWIEPDANHPNHCSNCVPYSRPEFLYSTLIHSGSASQLYDTRYAIHEAGVYQRVAGLKAGLHLQFSAYMRAYSTGPNAFDVRVGIDPAGGTNPYSPSVVWGPSSGAALGSWLLYTVDAVAAGPAATVFTYSRPSWPYEANGIYLDDASLIATGAGAGAMGAPGLPAYVLNQNNYGQVISPASTVAPASPTTYVVVAGDSLARISRRFGTTIDALRAANHLKTDVLQIGQVLIVPAH